jgi:hypothetical protein
MHGNEGNTWLNVPVETKETELTMILSTLITKRQKALNQENTHKFKYLRNRVNRERKICRAKYYENSIQHLKQCKSYPPGGTKLKSLVVQILLAEIVKKSSKP